MFLLLNRPASLRVTPSAAFVTTGRDPVVHGVAMAAIDDAQTASAGPPEQVRG
jgi:hypothetical protein